MRMRCGLPISDLARLNERHGLEDLVERAESARQGHEGVRVLDQHDLANEEVAEGDPAVEIAIRLLLGRQLDVAADRAATRLARPAIGGLHDARPAAGHHREAGAHELSSDLAAELVVGMVLPEARRAEDGDARTHEVKDAEAPHELEEDAYGADELVPPRLRSLEEAPYFRRSSVSPRV